MALQQLFLALADAYGGPLEIEATARQALLAANPGEASAFASIPLPQVFLDTMQAPDAHHVCQMIGETLLPWAPPQTTSDPAYVEHSRPKVHVELLGPDGLVKYDQVRLGLYGMLSDFEYGFLTHHA